MQFDVGWEQSIFLDQFLFREDPLNVASASIGTLKKIDAVLDRIDMNALREAQANQDALAAQQIILDLLLA